MMGSLSVRNLDDAVIAGLKTRAARLANRRKQKFATSGKMVVDASVAIKWVIEEAGTEHALALRRHQLS